ncbi:hypothetical protein BH11BAC3_BH11BAC3_42340 [soil metagenome]
MATTAFTQKVNIDSTIKAIAAKKNDDEKVSACVSFYSPEVNNDPRYSIDIGLKMLKQAQADGNVLEESSAYSFLGHGYRLTGNPVKALQYHHEAVRLAEKNGNWSLLCIANNQLAHIYKDRGEYDKAIQIYKLSAEDGARGMNETVKFWPLINLGSVYLSKNQPDSAVAYILSVYEKNSNSTDKNLTTLAFLNLAGAYSKLNNPQLAMSYFQQALKENAMQTSTRYSNMIFMAMADHYQRTNKPDSAEFYARKAIAAVTNTPFSYLGSAPANMLASLYETKNCDSTLKYAKIYKSANDSLYSSRANQQIQMMTFDEDIRQYQLNEEKEKYKNRLKLNATLAGLAVAMIVTIILFRNNKQRKKTNNKLSAILINLKATQAQLIQSEKMASLGELTAGIAHEIQNPLNFVNNFSEVSNELIDEMNAELNKGDITEAKAIAADVKQNLEKINHHGKRADAIVKGMLQHSQSSTGKKESTDINALCDEYLRLSYHGLRAKDKSFNATIKTGFDNSIGNINIIPQDIGRGVMNLLTNAFYAVDEKKKAAKEVTPFQKVSPLYEPMVSISTKKINDKIEIRVTDNGNGIPQKIIDKIFQPFFTTKPTGQGTGLGLSLSYDIIKAHGGDIKVETEEGKATTFIITINR